jgi:WD40 repeat protein
MLSLLRKRKKAFLSSTSKDLLTWRDAVGNTLRGSGLTVLRMEEFPAIGKGAAPGSLDMLKKCDLLVGIYARRYGTVGDDGRSITEQEYDGAKEMKLPRICFMLNEGAEWPTELIEGEPGASALQRFKDKVRSDVIVAEFSTVEELQAAAEAAALEYLQRERRRRRIQSTLFALGAGLVLAISVFGILLTGTKAHILPLKELAPPTTDGFNALAADSFGGRFATGGTGGEVFLWNPGEGTGFSSMRLGTLNSRVKDLVFSPGGDRLVGIEVGSAETSRAVCWSVPAGEVVWQLDAPQGEGTFTSVANQKNGNLVALGTGDGTVMIVSGQGAVEAIYKTPAVQFGIEHGLFGLVQSLDFSPDGKNLAIAYLNGLFATLALVDGSYRRIQPELPKSTVAHSICFGGNDHLVMGTMIQKEDLSQPFRLWVYDLGGGVTMLTETDNLFWKLIPQADSRFVLSANWSGEVTLWHVRRKTQMATVSVGLNENERLISDLGYLQRRHLILSVSENKLIIWQLEWRSLGGIRVPWQGQDVW